MCIVMRETDLMFFFCSYRSEENAPSDVKPCPLWIAQSKNRVSLKQDNYDTVKGLGI
jgi:hypothetical protein